MKTANRIHVLNISSQLWEIDFPSEEAGSKIILRVMMRTMWNADCFWDRLQRHTDTDVTPDFIFFNKNPPIILTG